MNEQIISNLFWMVPVAALFALAAVCVARSAYDDYVTSHEAVGNQPERSGYISTPDIKYEPLKFEFINPAKHPAKKSKPKAKTQAKSAAKSKAKPAKKSAMRRGK